MKLGGGNNTGGATRTSLGFTLIEALVVIAIAAILLAVAAPSFRSTIGSMNVRAISSDLISDLTLARSEAIKRNAVVTVTPVVADSWSSGWEVTSGGAVLTRRGGAGGVLITGLGTNLSFGANGRLVQAAANVSASIASSAAGATARCVLITPTGAARVRTGAC